MRRRATALVDLARQGAAGDTAELEMARSSRVWRWLTRVRASVAAAARAATHPRRSVAAARRLGMVGTVRRLGQGDARIDVATYARWLAAHTVSPHELDALRTAAATWPLQPLITIVTPVFNTDPAWLRACVASVLGQAYPRWELCLADDASTSAATVRALAECAALDSRIRVARLPANAGVSAASNAALEGGTGDFIALLDHDDELAPEALAEIVRHINDHPGVDVIYSDEDKIDPAGTRRDPYFKPDWSPDHLLNFNYLNHLLVMRRTAVESAGRFRTGFEGAQDYDLVLRVTSVTDRVGHVPRVLYHWRQTPGSTAAASDAKPWAIDAGRRALASHIERHKLEAAVEDGAAPGLFRVRRRVRGQPLVSILIPTAGQMRRIGRSAEPFVARLARGIAEHTRYPHYEIIVIDDGRLPEAAQTALASTPHRRVSHPRTGPFNFSAVINHAARAARGEHLLILNDDIEMGDAGWLTALLEYSQDEAVGAVGAKLTYPDGRLQHIGIVLGVNKLAAHAFHQAPGASAGYFGSAIGPRNYCAVTGACLMTRAEVFGRLGGLNEQLAVDFNDVDYCLRAHAAGLRVVFTPYAELVHHESASLGARVWDPASVEYMQRTWGDAVVSDPFYNVNLTRDASDYRLR